MSGVRAVDDDHEEDGGVVSGGGVSGGPVGGLGEADDPTDARAAQELLRELAAAGWTFAVAESLTGGLLAAGIVAVPGASRVFRGGAVTYATDTKADVVGVDPGLLAARGPVDPDVAEAMAEGVRRLFRADVGMATTGVAGPESQGGREPGHVYVAVVTPRGRGVRRLRLEGDRAVVRGGAVAAALDLALAVLREGSPDGREQS